MKNDWYSAQIGMRSIENERLFELMAVVRSTRHEENSLINETLFACRSSFAAVVLFSFGVNILMLTAPLYMLQIFDRVIASRSTDTLLFVTLIAAVSLLTLAGLEATRTRLMVHISIWLDRRIGGSVFTACVAENLRRQSDPSVQSLRDLVTLRTFLTGPGIFPIVDAPWTPIFLTVIYILHPLLGTVSLIGAIMIFTIAIANEFLTRTPLKQSTLASIKAMHQAESAVRNANVLEAMGMLPNLVERWREKNEHMLAGQASASIRSGNLAAISRFVRQGLQVGVLGAGAWLVLQGELTAGMMVAASILMSRALAPVDQAIGSWRSAIAARDAYGRIKTQLAGVAQRCRATRLPQPTGRVSVEGVTYFYPGAKEPTLRSVTFSLEPGEVMGLIGPTASGKSTLAESLVGVLAPNAGNIRLDGANVAEWDRQDLGVHIGYLPQGIELFGGTVRENIARFGEVPDDVVISASQLANVHELILQLPLGYESDIGDGGVALSGGQRQRIALARAVLGNVRFVVLDEPNSNLDSDGEAALIDAIATLKSRGVTIVVIAHRPSILRHVDKVLILRNGTVEAFGPKNDVIPTLTRPQSAVAATTA